LLAEVSPGVRACIEALEAVVRAQDARIVALEARPRQDSGTSSRPPSSDPPKTRARRRAPPAAADRDGVPRRRGGQPGHPGHHRLLLGEERVDRLVEVAPPACLIATPAGCSDGSRSTAAGRFLSQSATASESSK